MPAPILPARSIHLNPASWGTLVLRSEKFFPIKPAAWAGDHLVAKQLELRPLALPQIHVFLQQQPNAQHVSQDRTPLLCRADTSFRVSRSEFGLRVRASRELLASNNRKDPTQ